MTQSTPTSKPVQEIHCGDNLTIMRQMEDDSVDLIYFDPPFFSNRKYKIMWGDKEEVRCFEDHWDGEIEHYITWMKDRLIEMERILKPTGSIYLNCDYHAVHYLKVIIDKISKISNFKTQITWKRCLPKGNAKTFANNSDYILYYVKSKDFVFNVQYGDYLKL